MKKRNQKEYEILFDSTAQHVINSKIKKGTKHIVCNFRSRPYKGHIIKSSVSGKFYRITDIPTLVPCDTITIPDHVVYCMAIKKIRI